MKLEEVRRLKEELLIKQELPTRGVRGFRFTKRTITVTVTSDYIGERLPARVRGRTVYYEVEASKKR